MSPAASEPDSSRLQARGPLLQRLRVGLSRLHLQTQVLLMMAVLLLPLFAGLAWWNAEQAGHAARSALQAQARALARAIASVATPAVLQREPVQVELTLLKLADFPEGRRLTVTTPSGEIVTDVVSEPGSTPRARYGMARLTPPTVPGAAATPGRDLGEATVPLGDLATLQATTGEQLVAWAPLMGARVIGWARVELDGDTVIQARSQALWATLSSSAAMLAVTLAVLSLLLRLALRSLRRAADFAARLPRAEGTTLRDKDGSHEIRELRHALNFASLHLHHQYRQLTEQMAELDIVTELSSDGFAVIGTDHQIAYANPAFRLLTGHPDKGPLDALLERLNARLQAGTPTLRAADWADMSERQLTLAMNEPDATVLQLTVRPGVGQYRHLLYLRDISREAAVDRMKSEFLATAAHELRTPMVSIYGYAELLLNRPVSEERRHEMLDIMHRQTKRLIDLVSDLLDLARIESRQGADFKRVVQPLPPLLHEAVEAIVVPGGKHTVRFDVEADLPLVWVDEAQLGRALNNLLSNAVKYWPEGGEIVVSGRRARHDQRAGVAIRIIDQGLGMTASQVARAFERFYRADAACHIAGTGLGLALVREIVQLHGGLIQLDSTPTWGTTVTLWLPAAVAVPAVPAPAEAPVAALSP